MRRWSELTRVERVHLYTRQSLYLVLVGFNAFALLAAAPELDPAEGIAVLAGGVVVSALGLNALIAVLDRYPAVRPLPWARVAPLLGVGALALALALALLPDAGRGAAVMIVAATVVLVFAVLPDRAVMAALVLGSAALYGLSAGAWTAVAVGAFIAFFLAFTMRASLWLLGIVQDLDEASRVKAELAVVEERLRFSRDVHDVLGRRLSTIAVQAELAATLAARGDEQAAARMLEVRGVAHDALREARELARGYRPTSFEHELEGARSLLGSAGIDVELAVEELPRGWHEAAGWVVREAVTNVLRHSRAGRVRIAYDDERLRVDNDGARDGGSADGSGLRGLRERLAPLGASLNAGADRGVWSVTALLPGTGPLT